MSLARAAPAAAVALAAVTLGWDTLRFSTAPAALVARLAPPTELLRRASLPNDAWADGSADGAPFITSGPSSVARSAVEPGTFAPSPPAAVVGRPRFGSLRHLSDAAHVTVWLCVRRSGSAGFNLPSGPDVCVRERRSAGGAFAAADVSPTSGALTAAGSGISWAAICRATSRASGVSFVPIASMAPSIDEARTWQRDGARGS